jgi:hypothetical protein
MREICTIRHVGEEGSRRIGGHGGRANCCSPNALAQACIDPRRTQGGYAPGFAFLQKRKPEIQRSLRELGVLTQCLSRGPRGADEPRAIAKLAGRDGNGS